MYRIAWNVGSGKHWRIWQINLNSPKFYLSKFYCPYDSLWVKGMGFRKSVNLAVKVSELEFFNCDVNCKPWEMHLPIYFLPMQSSVGFNANVFHHWRFALYGTQTYKDSQMSLSSVKICHIILPCSCFHWRFLEEFLRVSYAIYHSILSIENRVYMQGILVYIYSYAYSLLECRVQLCNSRHLQSG